MNKESTVDRTEQLLNTDELEYGRVGDVGKKCKKGKIEFCF